MWNGLCRKSQTVTILSGECPFGVPFRFGQIYHLENGNNTEPEMINRDDDGTDGFFIDGATENCCFTREFWNGKNWICRKGLELSRVDLQYNCLRWLTPRRNYYD